MASTSREVGCLGVWEFGGLDVWVFGRLGVWTFGCLDVWVWGGALRGKGEAESFPLREGKGVVRCGIGGRLLWKRFGNRFSFRSWRWELEVEHGG